MPRPVKWHRKRMSYGRYVIFDQDHHILWNTISEFRIDAIHNYMWNNRLTSMLDTPEHCILIWILISLGSVGICEGCSWLCWAWPRGYSCRRVMVYEM